MEGGGEVLKGQPPDSLLLFLVPGISGRTEVPVIDVLIVLDS